jgi:hypothetical protein
MDGPLVLCHPACSGGSMIYRLLVSHFQLIGVSEISHCFPFGKDKFIPSDPEHALMVNGELGESEFEDIFFDRILNSNNISQNRGKQLLIREHTHTYFFMEQPDKRVPVQPSWIVEQYEKRLDKTIKCIVTVRDPIDSWLSISANFPRVAPDNFHEYCRRYKGFIRSVFESKNQNTILLVKYEDIILNQHLELSRIAEFLEIPLDGSIEKDWTDVLSTGNSGRQSEKIEKRQRRPFGFRLIREARQSNCYRYIVEQLGYQHLCDGLPKRYWLRAAYTDSKRVFASIIKKLLSPVVRWSVDRSNVP